MQCLASFISDTGLLPSRHLYYLRGLFTLWACKHFKSTGTRKMFVKTELDDRVKEFEERQLLCTGVKINVCAVWDTVSALGFPTALPPRPLSFVGREVPKAVQFAFQALALNESRASFKPCVWEKKECTTSVVNQCWFLGSHRDIGGNGDSALGAVTFIWMIGQLKSIPDIDITFNEVETATHLRHRFLEWDYDVKKIFGILKEKLILSNFSDSGEYFSTTGYRILSM